MNKQTLTSAVVAIALLLLIGWSFLKYLDSTGKQGGYDATVPPKAVMEQAEAINETRLADLAQQGQISLGMTMAQVRTALGEPQQALVDSLDAQVGTTWWYDHDGGRRVIRFGADGRVVEIED